MSYSQYYGQWGHIKSRRRTIMRPCLGPTEVLMWDPCPFGLPDALTVAHVIIWPGVASHQTSRLDCSFKLRFQQRRAHGARCSSCQPMAPSKYISNTYIEASSIWKAPTVRCFEPPSISGPRYWTQGFLEGTPKFLMLLPRWHLSCRPTFLKNLRYTYTCMYVCTY